MIPYNSLIGAPPNATHSPPPMMQAMSMPMARTSPQPMYGSPQPLMSLPLAGSVPPVYPVSGSPPPQGSRVVRVGSSPAQVPRITRLPVNPGPANYSPPPPPPDRQRQSPGPMNYSPPPPPPDRQRQSPGPMHSAPQPPPGNGQRSSPPPMRMTPANSSNPQRSPRPPGAMSPRGESRGESDMWRAHAHAVSARPDPGMTQAMSRTSRTLKLPRNLGDSVALTEETVDPHFHYGPGLRVSNHSPYVVQKANLRGENNNDISEKIALYDTLLEVDGTPTIQVDPEESLVGEAGSMAHLTLQSGTTRQRYDILCKRHLPSPVPQGTRKRYKALSHLAGQDLRADAQVIADLEKLRLEVSDGFGMAKDLLADSSTGTLGMHLKAAENDRGGDASNVVTSVVPGGPAWLTGKVRAGDQIISIDGEAVDGGNLLDMLQGDGCVGTMKVIKFRSPQGLMTEAAICRTPMSDVERLGAVIESLQQLEENIKAGADRGVLLDLHREVAKGVISNGDSNGAKLQALANRLLVTQLAISDGVNGLLSRLHPLGSRSPAPSAQSQDNVEQLKRQLEESMANTDALRQRAKHLNQQLKEMEEKMQQQTSTDGNQELWDKLRAAEAQIEILQCNQPQNLDADRIRERAEVYENKWNEESKRAEALESALTRMQASKDVAEQQARLLEEKNRGLENRMKELEDTSRAEIEHHRRERERSATSALRAAAPPPPPASDNSIREEYEGLLKELADAGLKDPQDVDRLLKALKGPPATDASTVAALLSAVQRAGLTTPDACAKIIETSPERRAKISVKGPERSADDVKEENKVLRERIDDLEKALGEAEATAKKGDTEKPAAEKPASDTEEMQQLRDHDEFMTQLVQKLQAAVRDAQAGADTAMADRDAAVTQLEKVSDALRRAAEDGDEIARVQLQDKQALEAANREVRTLQGENDKLKGEIDKLKGEIDRLQGEIGMIKRKEYEDREEKSLDRDARVQQMQGEIVGLRDQLKRANQTIEDLRRGPPLQLVRPRSVSPSRLSPPFIEPAGGVFASAPIRVQIISPDRGTTIYATTTGSDPAPSHHEYSGLSPLTFPVSRACTIKAMVSNGLYVSAVTTGDFAFEGGPLIPLRSHSPTYVPTLRAQSPAPFRSPTPVRDSSPYMRDFGSPRGPSLSPARPHTVGAAPDGGPRLAGVGVVLKRDKDMVRVKEIAPGSAADIDGRIAVRDRLLSIDGRSVEGKSMSMLGDEIRGVEGSYISMTFSRASGRGMGHEFEVALCRTVPLMVKEKLPV